MAMHNLGEAPNRATGVTVSTASYPDAGRGSNPMVALHDLQVSPIPLLIAKQIIEKNHYLHSLPGGTKLTFGVFAAKCIKGAVVFGAGPQNACCLVNAAKSKDCLTLTRLWLSDDLPGNGESRIISVATRLLRKHTTVKFILSYADPSQGHLGIIYQAAGWLYTGLSAVMPLYDLGDGIPRHSRSVGQVFGSHSVDHFTRNGIAVKLVPQVPKHRYLHFLDSSWQLRLNVPVLPYPKKEIKHAAT